MEVVNVTSQEVDRYLKFIFSGKITYNYSEKVKEYLNDAFVEKDGYIVDMIKVEQIDSTGFGVLVNLGKKIIANKKNMVIVVANPLIRELFQISKLDKVFAVVNSQEKAIKILDDGGIELPLKINKY